MADEKIEIALPSGISMKFCRVEDTIMMEEQAEILRTNLRTLKQMKAREDDVIICGFLKSGTNWMWEITKMLVSGKTEYQLDHKIPTILEWNKTESFDSFQSPRILSSHMRFHHLPQDMIDKKCKIVYMQRNPKDVCVSLHHYGKMMGIDWSWEDCFHLFLNNYDESFISWFGTTLDWEKACHDNPLQPILVVHYEDVKGNFLGELKRIAKFLEIERNDEYLREVMEKCQFQTMSKAKFDVLEQSLKEDREKSNEQKEKELTHRKKFYRKGEYGDWKNVFTVRENERFDEVYSNKMENSRLKFTWA